MKSEVLYLSSSDVASAGLTMNEVVKTVEEVFREKGENRTEMPPKPGIHPVPDAFIHAMPAFVPAMKAAGMKWVSGFPENQRRGLPYITGLLVLNDPGTGIPLSIMDASWITAKRTGAATAVAARYLAREDSRVFGVLGCGVQGRTNLEALLVTHPGLEHVMAYDIVSDASHRYADEMASKHGVSASVVDSQKRAVDGSDIVVTAGPILKHPKPVIEPSWFAKGAFACPIDFDSYWKPEAMRAADKFCTDDREQLGYYQKVGYFSGIPEVHADLGEIVTGRKSGREDESERIISMNLGVAIEDMATAVRVYERAKAKGIGTWLQL